ncbi:hypothetical protein V5N11_006148 [Cardamine amara subsp. amara]|uniref:Gag protease polyprotein n=1 Tax=Cardamine amara subsp. amara TaxID=228776 RepID=A0ABD0ZPF4_CARAN
MITMDFVVGLPISRTKDAIWVVVDRLTKCARFLAIKKTDGSAVLARKYVREIVRLYGVPVSIVSDRDPKFTSEFWNAFRERDGHESAHEYGISSSDGWTVGEDYSDCGGFVEDVCLGLGWSLG